MDGETELHLQGVDRTGPVDLCASPFVSAVTQSLQPAGPDVLVREAAVDAPAAQPTQRANGAGRPALQQLVYCGAHTTTHRPRESLKVNPILAWSLKQCPKV